MLTEPMTRRHLLAAVASSSVLAAPHSAAALPHLPIHRPAVPAPFVPARPRLFRSFILGGFECSSHRRADGRRLDLIAGTRHDVMVLNDYQQLAEHGIHLHETIDQEDWVRELSRYDAGWLHAFSSRNDGDLSRANWDDLNYPARIATYAVAGLPMIQADNAGSIVATQALCDGRGLGVTFTSIPHLAAQLKDRPRMAEIRDRVYTQRDDFTFDAHADRLVAFLRQAVASAAHGTRRGHPCGG